MRKTTRRYAIGDKRKFALFVIVSTLLVCGVVAWVAVSANKANDTITEEPPEMKIIPHYEIPHHA